MLLPNEHDAKERGEKWELPEGGCPADLLAAAERYKADGGELFDGPPHSGGPSRRYTDDDYMFDGGALPGDSLRDSLDESPRDHPGLAPPGLVRNALSSSGLLGVSNLLGLEHVGGGGPVRRGRSSEEEYTTMDSEGPMQLPDGSPRLPLPEEHEDFTKGVVLKRVPSIGEGLLANMADAPTDAEQQQPAEAAEEAAASKPQEGSGEPMVVDAQDGGGGEAP